MKTVWGKFCLAFIIITGVFGYAFWDTVYYSFQEQVEVYDTETGYDYKANGYGGNITAKVDFTLGEAGSIVTTTKRRGSSSSTTKYYYIIPVVFNSEPCFICTEVSESKKYSFDALLNANSKVAPPAISLTGTFKKLDKQMYDYMVDCVQDCNSYYDNALFENDKELRAHVLQVCLVPLNFESRNILIMIFAGLIVFDIFFLFMGIRKRKKLAAEEAAYMAELESVSVNNYTQTNTSSTETTSSVEDTTQNKDYHNTLDQFNQENKL